MPGKLILALLFSAGSVCHAELDFLCWTEQPGFFFPPPTASEIQIEKCGGSRNQIGEPGVKDKEIVCHVTALCEALTEEFKSLMADKIGKEFSSLSRKEIIDAARKVNYGNMSVLTCRGRLVNEASQWQTYCPPANECAENITYNAYPGIIAEKSEKEFGEYRSFEVTPGKETK